MATFQELHELANSEAFKQKVLIAMVKVALQIKGEAYVDNARHTKRQAFAQLALNEPYAMLNRFRLALVAPGTLDPNSYNDGDIEYLIGFVFDDLAGVEINDAA